MNNRNYQDAGSAYAMAGAGLAFFVFFFIFAFISLGMTALCALAWKKPFTFGAITITPQEAHGFVCCGIAAAVLLPILLGITGAMLGFSIPRAWSPFVFIAGYTAGSLSFGLYCVKQEEAKEEERALARETAPQVLDEAPVIHEERPPFRFASWNDEEAR